MPSLYLTGDIHGDITRLSVEQFPEQQQMSDGQDNNFICITGDFGLVWNEETESQSEKDKLDELERKPFTTLWVDGNHENFDRLYSNEYPIKEWCGGKVQFIRPHIIHLLRGEIYHVLGKKIFTFGGASSHDISDGILEPEDPRVYMWMKTNRDFRINHLEWWKEELASEKEMRHGRKVLCKNNNKVDYIITHCLPQEIASLISAGVYKSDSTTLYLQKIAQEAQFNQWYCGHYHIDKRIYCKYNILYHDILRVL